METENDAKQAWIDDLTEGEREGFSDTDLDEIWDEMKQEVRSDDFRAKSRKSKMSKSKRKIVKESRRKNRKN